MRVGGYYPFLELAAVGEVGPHRLLEGLVVVRDSLFCVEILKSD